MPVTTASRAGVSGVSGIDGNEVAVTFKLLREEIYRNREQSRDKDSIFEWGCLEREIVISKTAGLAPWRNRCEAMLIAKGPTDYNLAHTPLSERPQRLQQMRAVRVLRRYDCSSHPTRSMSMEHGKSTTRPCLQARRTSKQAQGFHRRVLGGGCPVPVPSSGVVDTLSATGAAAHPNAQERQSDTTSTKRIYMCCSHWSIKFAWLPNMY